MNSLVMHRSLSSAKLIRYIWVQADPTNQFWQILWWATLVMLRRVSAVRAFTRHQVAQDWIPGNCFVWTELLIFISFCEVFSVCSCFFISSKQPILYLLWFNQMSLIRVLNCSFLVAIATKTWVLATRISHGVASGRSVLPWLIVMFREIDQE